MSFETNFAKQFELTMDVARDQLKAEEFYKLRNKTIERYMDECFRDRNYLQNIAGVYELVKEYFSKEKIADFCLETLFKGRLNSYFNIYYEEMRKVALDKLQAYYQKRQSLVNSIQVSKAELNESPFYQDILQLRQRAKSTKTMGMLDKIIAEYEGPVDKLYEELSELNISMNQLLFEKDSLDENEQACLEIFIQKQLLSSIMNS